MADQHSLIWCNNSIVVSIMLQKNLQVTTMVFCVLDERSTGSRQTDISQSSSVREW